MLMEALSQVLWMVNFPLASPPSWPGPDEPCFATGANNIKSGVPEGFPLVSTVLWSSHRWLSPSPLCSVLLLPFASPQLKGFPFLPNTRKSWKVHGGGGGDHLHPTGKLTHFFPPFPLLLSHSSPELTSELPWAWWCQGEFFPPAVLQALMKHRNQLCPGICKGSGARTLVMQHFWTLTIYLSGVVEVSPSLPELLRSRPFRKRCFIFSVPRWRDLLESLRY